jgi:hypothetical protein
VIWEEPVRAGASNGVEVTIRPHVYLRCPNGHERRHLDPEYRLRCQEWLLDDNELVRLTGRATWDSGLCRCKSTPAFSENQQEMRRTVITQTFGDATMEQDIEFKYPVAICTSCELPRGIGEDFRECWSVLDEP